jgi:hypothetical protein
MDKYSLRNYQIKQEVHGKDICHCVEHQGGSIRMGKGDHAKVYDKNGNFIESVPLNILHVGILRAIVKTLIAAGFISLIFIVVSRYFC